MLVKAIPFLKKVKIPLTKLYCFCNIILSQIEIIFIGLTPLLLDENFDFGGMKNERKAEKSIGMAVDGDNDTDVCTVWYQRTGYVNPLRRDNNV